MRAATFRRDGEPAPAVADALGCGAGEGEKGGAAGDAGKEEGGGQAPRAMPCNRRSDCCLVMPPLIAASGGPAAQQGRVGAATVESRKYSAVAAFCSRRSVVHGRGANDETRFASVSTSRICSMSNSNSGASAPTMPARRMAS